MAIEQPLRRYHHRNRRRRSNAGAPACTLRIEDSDPRTRRLCPPRESELEFAGSQPEGHYLAQGKLAH